MKTADRKEHLLKSAIQIIDELGFQKFTIKELSKRQNISEAAIYRHFSGKQEILSCILEEHRRFFEKTRGMIENSEMSAMEAVEYYIASYLDYFEQQPAMIAILNCYDSLSHEKAIAKQISELLSIRLDFLTALFEAGIQSGEFTASLNAKAMSYMMVGTMTAVTLDWKVKNYSFALSEAIRAATGQVKSLISRNRSNME